MGKHKLSQGSDGNWYDENGRMVFTEKEGKLLGYGTLAVGGVLAIGLGVLMGDLFGGSDAA